MDRPKFDFPVRLKDGRDIAELTDDEFAALRERLSKPWREAAARQLAQLKKTG